MFWSILSSFRCSSQASTKVSNSLTNDSIALDTYIDEASSKSTYIVWKTSNVLTDELHHHPLRRGYHVNLNHSCQCSQIKHCRAVRSVLLLMMLLYHRRYTLRQIVLSKLQLQGQSCDKVSVLNCMGWSNQVLKCNSTTLSHRSRQDEQKYVRLMPSSSIPYDPPDRIDMADSKNTSILRLASCMSAPFMISFRLVLLCELPTPSHDDRNASSRMSRIFPSTPDGG